MAGNSNLPLDTVMVIIYIEQIIDNTLKKKKKKKIEVRGYIFWCLYCSLIKYIYWIDKSIR